MDKKYKLQSIKVFGSKENLFYNTKKYRKVYDESESCYLYCELAFYNKFFDEKDWKTSIRFICKDKRTGKQVCDFNKDLEVRRDKNIVYVREGWGTPEPGWWKKGAYEYQVYIDGDFIGDTQFYVVSEGAISPENNPYFSIEQIQLFEGPRSGVVFTERNYFYTFNRHDTRYINVEMRLKNLQTESDNFPLELQFNFYNNTGQLKAHMSYFKEITDQRPQIILDTGYGSDNGGYWYEGNYTLECIFMDKLIAVIPFEVGEKFIAQDGSHPYSTNKSNVESVVTTETPALTFEEAMDDLNDLIGLNSVKEQLNEFASFLQFLKIRKEKGFEENTKFNIHSIFMGNPGTGKTTVAKMLGKIYYSLGLLSTDKVHEVGRVDLVGEYIGQTAPKVKKAIDKARGGVLFIDEAYALSNRGDDSKDFGKEVIEVLLKEMSDGQGDLAIICAGYPKEMQDFLNSNPGLSSRIRNVIFFPDYIPDEMMAIAEYKANMTGVVLEEEARIALGKKIVEVYRNRDTHFGNARFVNGVIDEAKQNMALRLMKNHENLNELDKASLSTIVKDDIVRAFRESSSKNVLLPIDEALYAETLNQLHDLIGLENVKQEVMETAKLVRYYREIGKDIKKSFSIHTVFKGNPGTGKTTVARIIVQIYKALGILERGHVVEVDRKDLVAGFTGQTAIKTAEMIEKAKGGGLFIDEAYSLTSGGNSDFGREAVETLLKSMEDLRGEIMVIVAGYPQEMDQFLEANPGLMSRFDRQFNFEDYSAEELFDIAELMFDKEDLKMNEEAQKYFKAYIEKLLQNKHKYFGNARTIRKIVAEAVKRQHLRMADVPSDQRLGGMIYTVTIDDVEDFNLMEEEIRPGIGFK